MLLLAGLTGCGSEPPRFRLNLEGVNPSDVTHEQKQVLVNALHGLFGGPNDPYPDSAETQEAYGLDASLIELAAGPPGGDELGRQRGLFREHCSHCHGISGDGAGPTARFLNPYPRDYRQGIFKFTSTKAGMKPSLDDLKRTLRHGIPGTAMPSFVLLPDDELNSLVEYVKYLSIRGQTEQLLYSLLVDQDEEITPDLARENMEIFVDQWAQANEASSKLIPDEPPKTETPEAKAELIAQGGKLFQDQKRAQCVKCHGPTALGDGGQVLYDVWNEPKKNLTPAQVAERFTLPIQQIYPRNLRLGIYRGGRRPVDIYRRIAAGIKGTPMPAAGPSPGNPGVLKPEEIWSLVEFVMSLPYDSIMTQEQIPHVTAHADEAANKEATQEHGLAVSP